jgi:hypothetical protein
MSLFLLVIAAGVLAFLIGKVWAISIPFVIGVIIAAVILGVGGSLNDTPLPLVTALATLAAGSAIVFRRRVMPI